MHHPLIVTLYLIAPAAPILAIILWGLRRRDD